MKKQHTKSPVKIHFGLNATEEGDYQRNEYIMTSSLHL